jgi:hypothetical protein
MTHVSLNATECPRRYFASTQLLFSLLHLTKDELAFAVRAYELSEGVANEHAEENDDHFVFVIPPFLSLLCRLSVGK